MNILSLIMLIPGALIFMFGFILYKTKAIEMLSGYNPNIKYDREGLANVNGKNLMYMGAVIVISNIIFTIFADKIPNIAFVSISALVIDIVFFSIKAIKESKPYELGEKSKSDNEKYYYKTEIVAVTILVIIIFGLIGGFMFEEVHQSTRLQIDRSLLNIKAGAVERNYDTKSITKVYLKNTIASYTKTSGEGIGKIERGTFTVTGMGSGSLFLESDKGPYLYVIMDKDFVIINNKDVKKTEEFYKEIQTQLKGVEK